MHQNVCLDRHRSGIESKLVVTTNVAIIFIKASLFRGIPCLHTQWVMHVHAPAQCSLGEPHVKKKRFLEFPSKGRLFDSGWMKLLNICAFVMQLRCAH